MRLAQTILHTRDLEYERLGSFAHNLKDFKKKEGVEKSKEETRLTLAGWLIQYLIDWRGYLHVE